MNTTTTNSEDSKAGNGQPVTGAARGAARSWRVGGLMLFALLLPGLVAAQPAVAGETRAAAEARETVEFLTGPDFLGRDALSGDATLAAGYVLAQLHEAGLRPAGEDGSYVQRFNLVQERPDTAAALLAISGREGVYGSDYSFSSAHAPLEATAPVVSLTATDPADAFTFAEENAAELAGAVVVVETDFEAPSAYLPPLSEAGALAVLVVGEVSDRTPVWQTRTEEPTFLDDLQLTSALSGRISPAFAAELLEAGEVTLSVPLEARTVPAVNIIALLPGEDPFAAPIMVGAHLDHLGVLEGETFPGADDNASGVAAALLTARQLAGSSQRPEGDVIFAFWTAEERGALGSAHYVTNPTVPLGSLRGYINLDMVGRNTTEPDLDDVAIVGVEIPAGSEALRTVTLEGLDPYPDNALKLEAEQLLEAHGLTAMQDVLEVEGQTIDLRPVFYLSSDTVSFIQAGVPTVAFSSGLHADYHAPGDTADKLSYGKIAKIARLLVELLD